MFPDSCLCCCLDIVTGKLGVPLFVPARMSVQPKKTIRMSHIMAYSLSHVNVFLLYILLCVCISKNKITWFCIFILESTENGMILSEVVHVVSCLSASLMGDAGCVLC